MSEQCTITNSTYTDRTGDHSVQARKKMELDWMHNDDDDDDDNVQ